MFFAWWRTSSTSISSTCAPSSLWRGEFGATPPFDVGPDTLFVAYSAWAEMTCFMTLGLEIPGARLRSAHRLSRRQQHPAALRAGRGEEEAEEGLVRRLSRLRHRGLGAHRQGARSRKDIGEGRWRDYGREQVFDYCEEDVRMSVRLLRAQLRGRGRWLLPADVERVLHWSNYSAKAIALIQARGMPIDMPLWNLVQENKAAVIGELLRRFDPSHGNDDPIYTPDGEWSYERFERWLVRRGVHAWPRLESGRLDIGGDAFKIMYHVPGIEELHALRDSLGVIVRAKLPIGRDGRNRPSLFPFGTATGRNAHGKSLYNAHAGMRSFMVFPPDTIGAYLDWRTQEVGIAAALSGDDGADARLSRRRHLSRAGAHVRPHRRP